MRGPGKSRKGKEKASPSVSHSQSQSQSPSKKRRRRLTPTRQLDPAELEMARQQERLNNPQLSSASVTADQASMFGNPLSRMRAALFHGLDSYADPDDTLDANGSMMDASFDLDPAIQAALEKQKKHHHQREQSTDKANGGYVDLGSEVQVVIKMHAFATEKEYAEMSPMDMPVVEEFERPFHWTMLSVCLLSLFTMYQS